MPDFPSFEEFVLRTSAYETIEVKRIRLKRLHRFASQRWLKARTVERARFWKGVMDWCVFVEYVQRPRSPKDRGAILKAFYEGYGK